MSKFNKLIDLSKKKNNVGKGLILGAAAATIVASGDAADTDTTTGKYVVVGITSGGSYTAADLANIAGTGVDISSLISVAQANSNTEQTTKSGETIDGGTDGKVLYTFGKVDFTGITLTNISKLYLDNEVVISDASLKASGITELFGTGTIKADTGLLDLDGITVATAIDIKDAAGNIIVPEGEAGAIGVTAIIEENTSAVGHFTITDASAVGTVTYVLSGADAALFNIDANGIISFKSLTDFETALDAGANNVYDLTVTATDEHGKSAVQTVAIIVTDVNDAPRFAGYNAGEVIEVNAAENQTIGAALVATDDDGDAFTYSLTGDDAALFTYSNGAIVFNNAPDFETPLDNGNDNVYEVVLTATDVHNAATSHTVKITVTDEPDPYFKLSDVNGVNGFRLEAEDSGDQSGYSVSSAGDLNGDGFDDLIIGATVASPNGKSGAGSVYVIFGKASGFATSTNLSDLIGTDGFRLDGQSSSDAIGISASPAGDINNDGFDDIIFGAFAAYGGNSSGSNYVVFGSATSFGNGMNVSSLNGTNGFRLDGANPGDSASLAATSIGDVNGDGFDDFIIGADRAEVGSNNNAGRSYVVFGKAGAFDPTIDLGSLTSADGFNLDGLAEDDGVGFLVSSAGDVNGDGYDDFIIAASGADSSYVIFGKASGFGSNFDLNGLNGANGFKLIGDYTGYAVSHAGDVNGDGYDDVIIGASFADPNGTNSGSSYVFFGKATGFASSVDLNNLNAIDGFRLDGAEEDDRSGYWVSSAGDFNGDGFDDLLINAVDASPNSINRAGSTYVIFGKASGFGTGINLDDLNGADGFRVDGVKELGHANQVSSAGDVNGDGYDDIIIGSFNPNPDHSGYSTVIYGGGQYAANDKVATSNADALIGTSGADTMNGLAGDDVLRAGSGDDTLIGGTGADRMYGNGGADKFTFTAGDSKIVIADDNSDNVGTISGYDIIEDFKVGNGTHNSETLEIVGANSIGADSDGLNGADSTLNVGGTGGTVIKASTSANGVMHFYDGDDTGTAAELFISTEGDVAAAIEYLQANSLGLAAGVSVGFDVGADTFIFTQGSAMGVDNDLDLVVRLEDVQIDSLVDVLGNGAGDLFLL